MVRGLLSSSDRVCSVTTVTPRVVPSSRVPEHARRRLALYTRECQRSRAEGAECARVASDAPRPRRAGPHPGDLRTSAPRSSGSGPTAGRRPRTCPSRPQPRRPNCDHSYPEPSRGCSPAEMTSVRHPCPRRSTRAALREYGSELGRQRPNGRTTRARHRRRARVAEQGRRAAAPPGGPRSAVFGARPHTPVCYVRITETERVTIR